MNFTCRFCGSIVELEKQDINYIRGKKAGHLKSCNKFIEIKNNITKEYLIEEYLVKGRSAIEIANSFGINSSTFITKLLKKFNIKIRKLKEANNSEVAKQKRLKTNIIKYGVDNPSKSTQIIEKIKANTDYKKLGENVSKTLKKFSKEKWREIEKKRAITMMKKYGIVNAACFDTTRQKMRLTAIKNIEEKRNNGHPIYPNFNPLACKMIDEFGKQNGYNFVHALNGGEYYISKLGYWVDGYDKEKNTVIEIDESFHFDKNGELKEKDVKRQKEIQDFLNCKFIRLKFDYNLLNENN